MNKLKAKIKEILCGKENDENGIECKELFGESVDLIISKVREETKREIIEVINKEYSRAEKMEGEYKDVKKAITVINVFNRIKEKL